LAGIEGFLMGCTSPDGKLFITRRVLLLAHHAAFAVLVRLVGVDAFS
jgi:hypothetical protein